MLTLFETVQDDPPASSERFPEPCACGISSAFRSRPVFLYLPAPRAGRARVNRCAFLLLASVAAAAAQPAAEVRRANQDLARAASPQLLARRAAALAGLIRTDPAAALAVGLPASTADALRAQFPEASGSIESLGDWSGEAEILVIDDFEHGASRKSLTVHVPGGDISVYASGDLPKLKCGDVVRVSGMRLGSEIAARAVDVQTVSGASFCSVTGAQKVAVVLVNFPATALPASVTAAAVQSQFAASSGHSLNTIWNEFSYGAASATADVFGPYTLSQNYTCDQTNAIRTAAIQVADPYVNWANYSRLYIIVPNVGTCAIGIGTIGCATLSSPSRGLFQASTSWIRGDIAAQGGDSSVAVLVHEGGHNLGLEHASSLTYSGQPLGVPGTAGTVDEYGDYYANMGIEYTFNGTVLFGHYDAQHKSFLGWLPAASIATVQSAGSFVLSPFEASAGTRALRVRRGLGTGKWLWLEYRTRSGSDSSFAALTSQLYSGATVHYEDPDDTAAIGYTRLLNFGAPASTDWTQPALTGTWADPYTELKISVGTPNVSGLPVSVTYDHPCAALAQGSASLGSGAASASVSVNAPAGCAWAALSGAAWITLTGAATGSGSGTVPYSVAANAGMSPRSGSISIGGQTYTVTQAGGNAPPAPLSVAPGSGSAGPGVARTFQFLVADTNGAGTITSVDVLFNTSVSGTNACHLRYAPAGGNLALFNDSGSSSTAAVIGSGAPPASNSQCTLAYSASSASLAGNTLTLNVSLSFSSLFVGGKFVYASAQDSLGAGSGYVQLGTWNLVPAGSRPVSDDFNGDHVPDLVWQNGSTRQVVVHYYGGAGGAADIGWNWLYSAMSAPDWRVVAVADFNRDGVPDLVWQNDATRQVVVHYYGGPGGASDVGWSWLFSGTTAPTWRVVAAADFNRDGVPDLVWQEDNSRQVVVHYYGGAGGASDVGWSWLSSGVGAAAWHVSAAADFNSDGVPDLVWMNDSTREVVVHYYGGSGGATDIGWSWLYSGAGAVGWHVVTATDFNGDTIPDLVWVNDATGQVTVHYYGGPGGATDVGWNLLYSGTAGAGWSVVN